MKKTTLMINYRYYRSVGLDIPHIMWIDLLEEFKHEFEPHCNEHFFADWFIKNYG